MDGKGVCEEQGELKGTETALNVSVSSLSGETLQLDVDHGCTIAQLKAEVAELWQVPPMCQRMVSCVDVPADSDTVTSSARSDPNKHEFTMGVSLDDVTNRLDSKQVALTSADGKFVTVAKDGRLIANKDAAGTLETFEISFSLTGTVYLKSACGRYVVAEPGGRLLANGDTVSPQHCFEMIQHIDATISLKSAHGKYVFVALNRELSAKGNDVGPWQRFGKVESPGATWSLHLPALRAIGLLKMKGGGSAQLDMISPRLQHVDADRRFVAMQALKSAAEVGNERAVHAAVACLADPDWSIRVEALCTLTNLTKKGDQRLTIAARARLLDPEVAVKRAALSALRSHAPLGDPSDIEAVCACLHDGDSQVRLGAVWTLGNLSDGSDGVAASALDSCAGDPHPTVREAALAIQRMLSKKSLGSRSSCEEAEVSSDESDDKSDTGGAFSGWGKRARIV